jgi:hypothetical protein
MLHVKQTNSVVLLRERTIPTERPPLVGEVNANFLEGVASSAQRIHALLDRTMLHKLYKICKQ